MIGLDTNILLRFFLDDDPTQSPKARLIIGSLNAGKPGWIGVATILEIVWVMKRKKPSGREEISNIIEQLIADDAIVVEHPALVAAAVQRFRSTKAEFADCLIAASARVAGCERMLTFDEIAARDAGMELIT